MVRAGTAPRQSLRRGRGSWESLVGDRVRPDALDVRRLTIDPGSVPGPMHQHRGVDNTYLVLDGELEVRAGSDQHRLAAGEAIFIPAGVAHATNNPGQQKVVLLAIYDGSTREDFHLVDAS